jgi:site-specific DNA-methyltransferase (adenine-specific)
MINITNEDNLNLMSRYPDKYFDLAIVDPPYFNGPQKLGYYGNGYYSNTGVKRKPYEKIGCWNIPEDRYFQELLRVSMHQIIWGINYFSVNGIGSGRIVWDKCNGNSSFSDGEIAYNSQTKRIDIFRYMWNGMLQGKNINEGHIQKGDKRKNEHRIHPTQKPVDLYKWLLMKYAKSGWRILDTHLGSGSIAIACIDMGFDLIGCEKDPFYYESSQKRIKEHQSQSELFSPVEMNSFVG